MSNTNLTTGGEQKTPLWLDCDPGHDDAFAILFAAYHPALDLIGISTVHGNGSLTKMTNNALSVLEAIGRSNIHVFPGAAKPFCREARAAPNIHGESGLDGTDLLLKPSRKPLVRCNAIIEMRDALLCCPLNTAWLVATGPLTNIALLFATFPQVASHIRGVSIMGGSVGGGFTSVPLGPAFTDVSGQEQPRIGNVTPYAEFNFWCDPEAAQSIFRNPILKPKMVLIPLDVTHQAFAGEKIQEMLLYGQNGSSNPREPTRLRKMFHELLMYFAHTYAGVFGLTEGPPLHDPLAVAVLLAHCSDPDVKISFNDNGGERWDVEIELANKQAGRTRIELCEDGVIIPRALDLDRFWKVLNECLVRADGAVGRT